MRLVLPAAVSLLAVVTAALAGCAGRPFRLPSGEPPAVVSFRHRHYGQPKVEAIAYENSLAGPLHDGGQKVSGLAVLMSPGEEASPNAPAVLILQWDSQWCLVYSLEAEP